jgi:hypothetical protein
MANNILSFRNYLAISLIASAVIYLVGRLLGTQIRDALNGLNYSARAVGMTASIADFCTEPLKFAFSGELFAALGAGFLWPILVFWFLFIFLMIGFALLGGGFDRAADTIR